MRFIYLSTMTLLFFCCMSACKSPHSKLKDAAPVSAASRDEQIKLVANEMNAYVRTLSRDTHIYHWAARSHLSKVPMTGTLPTDGERNDYLHYLIDDYWLNKENNGGMAMGRGVYFSAHPFSTRTYGTSDWVLIQALLPAGTRYFNFSASRPSFSSPSQTAISQLQCTASNPVTLFKAGGEDNCAKVMRDVMKILSAYMATYQCCSASVSTPCSMSSYAVVIRGSDVFKWDRLVAFSMADIPESDPHYTNRLLIEAIGEKSGVVLWPSLRAKPLPSGLDAVKWQHDNLWGCSDQSARDDGPRG